jgi:hypothetical protein
MSRRCADQVSSSCVRAQRPQFRRGCTTITSPTADLNKLSRTERTLKILETVEKSSQEAGGAGSGLSPEAFLRLEKAWEGVRNMKTGKAAGPAPQFVKTVSCLVGNVGAFARTRRASDQPRAEQVKTPLGEEPKFDVVVCGGTLG